MVRHLKIGNMTIGKHHPVYIIAELSANHNHDFAKAVQLLKAAKEAGANAIKLQTYTPDTITINCDKEYFRVGKGTIWEGKNLYQLYKEAYTPWDWQPELKKIANDLGMDLFSTPFDKTAVDFLEKMEVPAYKIASFELVDIPLVQYIAKTGKPIIMSTGMATLAEIDEAVTAIREAGCKDLVLLKCTSAYPAEPADMNLRTISHMRETFRALAGISDHTMGVAIPIAAVSLGACVIEKHFTLSRSVSGPDSIFSLEPEEFRAMVEAVRITEKALGEVSYGVTKNEEASRIFRRSLFVSKDMIAGDIFTEENLRSVRPAYGLHTRFQKDIIGHRATENILAGTPMQWRFVTK